MWGGVSITRIVKLKSTLFPFVCMYGPDVAWPWPEPRPITFLQDLISGLLQLYMFWYVNSIYLDPLLQLISLIPGYLGVHSHFFTPHISASSAPQPTEQSRDTSWRPYFELPVSLWWPAHKTKLTRVEGSQYQTCLLGSLEEREGSRHLLSQPPQSNQATPPIMMEEEGDVRNSWSRMENHCEQSERTATPLTSGNIGPINIPMNAIATALSTRLGMSQIMISRL